MEEEVAISRKFSRLRESDFTLTANQKDYESEVATYIVPSKRIIEIPDDFIGLKLMTGERFSFTTGVGETTKTLTLTYEIARDGLISLKGANVIVVKNSPTPREEWAVANYTVTLPKTVDLSGLTAETSYQFDIYYLFCDGTVKIVVQSADETAKTNLLNRAIRAVNMLNQENVKVGLKPGMIGLVIPERFKIILAVKTLAPIYLYGLQETTCTSPYARESFIELPVNVSDLLQWPEETEAYAKRQLMGL